ncbi:hypothetical protein BH23ACI1_BH23ACI1_32980 [soil metagenome]
MRPRRDEIADQLRQRVVAGLHLGVVREGDRLPSTRMLAAEVGADPRVVLAAYRQLEEEGLEVRPKSGIYVAKTATGAEDPLPQLAAWVVGCAAAGPRAAFRRSTFPSGFAAACSRCGSGRRASSATRTRSRGAARSSRATTAWRRRAWSWPRCAELPEVVRTADPLVTKSFHAAEVRRVAHSLGKPLVAVHLRPEFQADAAAYVYVPYASKEEFTKRTVGTVLSELLDDFTAPAMSQLVDLVGEQDDAVIEALAKAIEEKRKREDPNV